MKEYSDITMRGSSGSHPGSLLSDIMTKAKEFGADLVGITGVDELKESPSVKAARHIPAAGVVGHGDANETVPYEICFPEEAGSIIIIALSHPADKPELDWWSGKYMPPGNKQLIGITGELGEWMENNISGIKTFKLPYHVEKGGIFLKDAAVKAGLGVIGNSNLFISPEYGPRIRMRGLMVNLQFSRSEAEPPPEDFEPCINCVEYCLHSCPQGAFDEIIYSRDDLGQNYLPGKVGNYSRFKCNIQMEKDVNLSLNRKGNSKVIKYCRECELSCPVGM